MRNRDKVLVGALAGAGAVLGARAWLRARRRIELADRVVIVTGASSGYGLVVARQAAEQGAHLVLAARSFDRLRAAEAELMQQGARSVLSVATDVRDPEQVRAMVGRAIDTHGRVDILVNNAGIISVGPLETMSIDDFRDAMDTNYWGAYHATMAVLPHMKVRGFGRIANVVSVGGKVAVPHLVPYTVAKFALTGFTQGLRAELARHNILVTGIYPATMRTGGHTHAWFKGDPEAEYTWFAMSDSVPGLSVSADYMARRLWRAVCDGDAEVRVGWQTHLATVLHALFPNEVAETLTLVDRFLPGPSNLGAPARQGQELSGTIPDMLNSAVPAGTRPETG